MTNRTEVEYTLTATKTLEGTTLRDNQFAFVLMDDQMKTLQTAYNVDGKVTFDSIQVDQEAQFTYYLKEVIPEDVVNAVLDNILYDTTLWKVEYYTLLLLP